MENDEDLIGLLEEFQQLSIQWKEMIAKDEASQTMIADMKQQLQHQEEEMVQVY
jgi:hypothetical protein